MLLTDVAALRGGDANRHRTVVIGSGAVGLYAACQLAHLGQDVVLLESGSADLGSFPSDSYASVGHRHDGIRLGRNRGLGGTTNLWGGQLVEFQPIDFAGRDWLADSRWPLLWDELAPYYRRTYRNLGVEDEAQQDAPILAHFLGSSPPLEEGLEVFLTRWLKVPNFAEVFGNAIRTDPRLQVLLNYTAVGLIGSGPAVRGVRVADSGGRTHTLHGDRFILAAGTIEISRLLLHVAASTEWECPWRGNPNVGAYFQDHVGGFVGTVHPLDRRRFLDTFCTMMWAGHKYQPKMRLTNATLERTRILNVQAVFTFESSISENLVFLKQFLRAAIYSRRIGGIGDLARHLRAAGKYLVPLMWKYVFDNRIFVPSGSKISLRVQAEQVPVAESRIRIDPRERDAMGLPRVILDWRLGGEELRSIHEFALRCDRALRAAGLAEVHLAPALTALDPAFVDTLCDTNHQSGGARMGESERDGVVDRNLRVFGTNNLYVVGAATFRTNSNANTTFTALTLVTRLVEQLAATHALA
jgi:choline dehydrogenase-like flavoprotein